MTDHDRRELEKFSRYLRELGEWEEQHKLSPADLTERIRERIKAEVAIYERVYGEKP